MVDDGQPLGWDDNMAAQQQCDRDLGLFSLHQDDDYEEDALLMDLRDMVLDTKVHSDQAATDEEDERNEKRFQDDVNAWEWHQIENDLDDWGPGSGTTDGVDDADCSASHQDLLKSMAVVFLLPLPKIS